MNRVVSFLLASLFAGAAQAQETYVIQGTFSDGGTFSGTFLYPFSITIAPVNGEATGAFDVTTQGGTSGVANGEFTPNTSCPSCLEGATDGNSTPIEFQLGAGLDPSNWALTVNWSNALPYEAQQPITGGSETYDLVAGAPTLTRQIVSGTIMPVSVLLAQNAALQAQITTLQGQLTTAQAQVASLTAEVSAVLAERNLLDAEKAALVAAAERLKATIASLLAEIEKLKAKK